MNEYRFVVHIDGIGFDLPLSVATVSPYARNSTLTQTGPGEFQVSIRKTQTWPPDLALVEAFSELDELLDRLSLIDNHRIGGVSYTGFVDPNGFLNEPARGGGLTGKLTAGIPNPAKYYSLPQQQEALAGAPNPGLTRLHRMAQGMPDGIGRFMLLYAALQVIHGEKQAQVDDFLSQERPDMLVVQGKYRRETIVTHVRNLIGHPESVSDVRTLASQAAMYCPALSELVRKSILSNAAPAVV